MSRSASLRLADLRAIHALVGECRELGDDPVRWRRHFGAGLGRLTGSGWSLAAEMGHCVRGPRRDLGTAVAPLVGGSLARFDEPSPSALPPRAREVLRCLLEGDSDKQVVARLGLTRHTVNQYAKSIYAHFGARGRAELLARWVRRGWGGRFAWAD